MVNVNNNSSTTTFPCDCVQLSFTLTFSLFVKSFVFKSCLQICNHYSLSTALRMRRGPGPQAVIGQPSRGRGVVERSYHSHQRTPRPATICRITCTCTPSNITIQIKYTPKNNLNFIYVGFDFPRLWRKLKSRR